MILVRLKLCVYRCRVIEDLNFFSNISSITFQWCMDAKPVVRTWSKLKFKTENEIAVFFICVEIAVTFFCRIDGDCIFLYNIISFISLPVVKIFSVEQNFKA